LLRIDTTLAGFSESFNASQSLIHESTQTGFETLSTELRKIQETLQDNASMTTSRSSTLYSQTDALIPRRSKKLHPAALNQLAHITSLDSTGSDVFSLQVLEYSCHSWCSCACHKPIRFNTPKYLNSVIGSLFVGYNGLPISRPACTEQACLRASAFKANVTYHFPKWLLAWGIIATFSANNAPAVSLTAVRARFTGDDIFTMALNGDVQGIQGLFSQGLGSPNDVTHVVRDSLLTVRTLRTFP
jgi:hypothetical protein